MAFDNADWRGLIAYWWHIKSVKLVPESDSAWQSLSLRKVIS